MKKLIRHKTTNLFLRRDGSWTNDPARAVEFADISSAQAAVEARHLAEVELVYTSGQVRQYDLTWPLADYKSPPAASDTGRPRRAA